MLYLIAGIIVLGITTAIITYFGNHRRKHLPKDSTSTQEIDSDCCGQHELCERDSLLAAVSKKIDYYDDEELDIYIGTAPDKYDEKAIEEFSEVLYTLQEVEVAGWLRSLQLREINLPDSLKDEAFLIIEERRKN